MFVSYSWDSDDHKQWVRQFATQLREDGIDARLDAWHLGDKTIPDFMTHEVRKSDFILTVCTPSYRDKVDQGEAGPSTGSGWELRIASSLQFALNESKYVPVLRQGEWADAAPSVVLGLQYFDLRGEFHRAVYDDLLRKLYGQQEKAPALGTPPAGLEKESAEPLFDSQLTQSRQAAFDLPARRSEIDTLMDQDPQVGLKRMIDFLSDFSVKSVSGKLNELSGIRVALRHVENKEESLMDRINAERTLVQDAYAILDSVTDELVAAAP